MSIGTYLRADLTDAKCKLQSSCLNNALPALVLRPIVSKISRQTDIMSVATYLHADPTDANYKTPAQDVLFPTPSVTLNLYRCRYSDTGTGIAIPGKYVQLLPRYHDTGTGSMIPVPV